MGLFARLFTWGKSEANAVVDKLEDPVKMTEQGIRDLKKDLEASLKSLAEVKALAIKANRDAHEKKQLAADYEKKAILLLGKAQKGELDSQEADRLASEALSKKEQITNQAITISANQQQHEQMVSKLEANVKKIKSQINSWETELQTLKARAKVAHATEKLNRQMAQIDSSGTIAMLEKMKNRVSEQEALAASYGDIATSANSIDDEINQALNSGGTSNTVAARDSLAALKAKMGLK